MKHVSLSLSVLVLGALCGLVLSAQPPNGPPATQNVVPQAAQAPAAPAQVAEAVPFQTKDGKVKGWKVQIPGNRALATPAVVEGKVFIGGGFGSHEFYAFDAVTGKKLWQYQTADDGPTAAVAQDGHVAFNTESCELEILTVEGQPVWKKWLGDPLMSMPAIAAGKVYMAYPDSKGDKQHYLAGFELKTGKEFWKRPIAGEIITAPVVAEEKVYLATLEGSLYCFGQRDGELVWQEKKNITSSPAVWKQHCYYSRREEVQRTKDGKAVKQQDEQLARRGTAAPSAAQDLPTTRQPADYLDFAKRASSPHEAANQLQDAAVGFAGTAKGDAKIAQAQRNLGQGSVCGVWSYQGSRPFVYRDRLYSAMGGTVKCVDLKTEKVIWSKPVAGPQGGQPQAAVLDSGLTPPALVNGKVFLGTTGGAVLCLSAESGELLWRVAVGEPIVFQPAVSQGKVFVSTAKGAVVAIETGDRQDDGWQMWGANAAHDGLAK